ncbi:MAG: hypothetical protein COV32_02590 [Candidatus Yonathbacteria bacterium CG10_big_fil_rev_8_21_14_0_10_43_136]|uniref:Uncharacterized protein n=2 Tax=Parcubacteria group TaxID=1794811 RepID=A0A2M7Q3S6_9BACT|nr:MAG: hypothetical protein AUK15_02110 [Candidatus Nomurabacteria bacterium CG2_30_43_9]PIQ35634.1 MAG: hypothetical protein COW60_02855 [Candidatus Yonathbacteria bacterium CG17_big_fil_post_rev_8_21_14_2_50_43_9]PIR40563.1 MAG: hypothetical protein COV32_02590 [Candidatus Yonathbacteria bacterium CG10_big_fil_rev_8_21_14_0_10_43_136]PIX56940.1 MAG: hypothetical protein COZ48_03330 [Candidatus Yonathbacteria bacterium CG_4_10_14_3_um_filter_43_12]PIY58077.1 MAG: hypothetical protein COY98_03
MQQEQTKSLIVNIFTGAVIAGVFVAGYFVLFKKDTEIVTSVQSVARIAEQTAFIGVEIDATVKDLTDLSDAISRSKVFFDMPAFSNLENFSVSIPEEVVGRDNPFVQPEWKVKMKAQEIVVGKSATQQTSTQPAPVPDGLLGDFDTGI